MAKGEARGSVPVVPAPDANKRAPLQGVYATGRRRGKLIAKCGDFRPAHQSISSTPIHRRHDVWRRDLSDHNCPGGGRQFRVRGGFPDLGTRGRPAGSQGRGNGRNGRAQLWPQRAGVRDGGGTGGNWKIGVQERRAVRLVAATHEGMFKAR